jgi:NTE family protein
MIYAAIVISASATLLFCLFRATGQALNTPGKRSHRPLSLAESAPKGDVVLLAISGGGIRAAAFAYGAMEEMRKQNMMSRVAYISTVSGGSFTGAWWALYGAELDNWHRLPNLLAQGFQKRLAPGLLEHAADRTYAAALLYDKEFFNGKRFADIPDIAPHLIINATEMALGRRFPFTQEQLGCIGSDLGDLPLGYAVAASAAFPVAFSPARFHNYGAHHEDCFSEYEWERLGTEQTQESHLPKPASAPTDPVDYRELVERQIYMDHVNYSDLYLSDGGISDNLGLQAFIGLTPKLERAFQAGAVTSVAFVFIDAVAAPPVSYRESTPSIVDVGSRMSDLFLQTASRSTQDEMNGLVRQIRNDLRIVNRSPKVGCVRISFDDIHEPHLGRTVNDVLTRLSLKEEEINTLVSVGETAAAVKMDRINGAAKIDDSQQCQ